MPPFILFVFCIIYFFEIGIKASFLDWLATYTVKSGFDTKESASIYTSVYAGLTIIFKILFGFLPIGNSLIKITIFTIAGSITALGSVAIITYWEPKVGLFFFIICMSLFVAPLFSWCQSLPHSKGFRIASDQFIWVSISMGLTLGATPTVVGLVMKKSLLEIVFYYTSFCYLVTLIGSLIANKLLETERKLRD